MRHCTRLVVAGLLLVSACAQSGGSDSTTTTAPGQATTPGSTSSTAAQTTVVETTTTSLSTTTEQPDQSSLVQVNSLDIVYECRGSGSPAVVITHGYGGPVEFDEDWEFGSTLDAVSEVTMVCIYARPGINGSEARDETPQTVQTQVDDLLSFIDAIGIDEPPIVLGYSWGGLIAQLAAYQQPEKIAGLLLLDSTHWEYFDRLGIAPFRPVWPEYVDAAASGAEASVVDDLGVLPIHVLSAADPHPLAPNPDVEGPIWLELQDELAALSTNTRHDILEGTNHLTIPLQADEVSSAVKDLIERINKSG